MKVLVVLGTRPEAIKLAPVINALKESGFELKVVATGQHDELLRHVLEFFRIDADFLHCMNPDLIENTACMAESLKEVLRAYKPHCVIVQGDTLSCYMGAYTAFLNKIPVLHVEAGLRSHDKFSPFPEEMFRKLTDELSDVLFAPTKRAVENLLKEGFPKDRIVLTGNTVVDAVQTALDLLDRDKIKRQLQKQINREIDAFDGLVFITSHRRENIGEPMKNIRDAVLELAQKFPHLLFLWSLHKNPQVRESILEGFTQLPDNLVFLEPLSYPQTLYLLERSKVIITDSGGIQEEACTLRKPVLITRTVSERLEVVDVGLGKVVGTEKEKIVKEFEKTYSNLGYYEKLSFENPYGDGRASERIKNFFLCDEVKNFMLNYKKDYKGDLYECTKVNSISGIY
ncbi:non-hydrolyzing UDP-N-acetylglucosamine 2-epimerase [Hydrogenobacter hydrogenophilus]|uniref:UDP-N-acetylglucosamine 2-epimerase (non-hydrolyzing) n=1 Tax=Hydrogenobacter hydrogenophilus TaxID=35835 RepID=A0A285NQL1_9AQUI|nr:UDP-N-acetylglucosamine 2-epimerase (non-hydrolyzing) [Hydrogenobacter hydrogenophilus]SNZ11233.1 UDP-N-Acetylglucosamine 2-epimerase [Hydrogenobacter hydrogenophilus]